VLMIRMLIVGYVFAIRSERALCRDVRVNLAYRWFVGSRLKTNLHSPCRETKEHISSYQIICRVAHLEMKKA